MLVRIVRAEPVSAQVAEMCIALVASHMIAALRFRSGGVAVGAGRSVLCDVIVGRFFFGGELGGIARVAALERAVPGLVADTTECEAAFGVFADGEAVIRVVRYIGVLVFRGLCV